MTATAVQVSQQAGISEKEWVRLFPKQVTENYTSSITFVKQLTVVAVSTITYLKNAFPEESYYSETFGGLKLKILKDKCEDDLAQFMSTSMRQAFDAFDKKYVHQLALCFYRGSCSVDNLIEYHVFEYAYTSDGVSLTVNSKNRDAAKLALRCSIGAVKMRTAMLVRSLSLFVWQNCSQQLPDNFDVSLRLYYNEDSPEDYQAPGFGASAEPDHLQAAGGDTLCLGWVETPYHKFIARAFVRDLVDDSDAALPSDNLPEMSQDSQDDDDFQGGERDPSEASESALRCPCACAATDPDQALVTCQYCHTQQHAACFGLLAPAPQHCCADCAARDPARAPSCELLVGLETRKRQCLCIFRRALVLCSGRATVSGEELMAKFELSASSTAKMIRLLQSHYVLPHTDSQDLTISRKINPIRLKLAFKHFFQAIEPESMLDRLVAETAPADDPVADVLRPLERVALHADAGFGATVQDATLQHSIMQHTTEQPSTLQHDPGLQHYREVLTDNDMSEELPLSGSHNPVPDVERTRKKRKTADEDDKPIKVPKLRSGAKTHRKT